MARTANPTLGSVQCDCGQLADVKQARRGKGRYLYSHCPECGIDQRTGARVQAHLWAATVWRNGLKPSEPPPNVRAQPQTTEQEPVQRAAASVDDDFNPKAEPDNEPKQPGKQGSDAVSALKAVGVMGGLFLAVMGVVRSI